VALTRELRNGIGISALIIAADQASKWWITEVVMQPPQVIPVTSFFNIVLGFNRGVSFGIFDSDSQVGRWLLVFLALAISAALVVWMTRATSWWVIAALGLIVGGALGNVIDRALIGAVVDFLDFHWAGHHWPAFNIADSAISTGAVVLIADSLFVGDGKD